MSMVCGLDLHRGQITFDALEVESGEVWRGRIWSPDRARFRRWLREELAPRAHGQPVAVAVEGCTGWRYVVEEITAVGFEAHVAEPADTQAARGRKKRAKTDRADARLMRELLQRGDLCESWIPPQAVLEWRERVRLYKTLLDQRRMWIQRIHAELFQHGVSLPEGQIASAQTRDWLAGEGVQLSGAARQRITVGYHILDATDAMRLPLRADLEQFARRQPACKALAATHYGVGPLTAVVVWAELGDCRRFSRSMQVVRHTGLDVTVDQSDRHRGRSYPFPSGSRDAAVGAVRGWHGRLACHQPRPGLLPVGQKRPRRQDRRHLHGPQAGPTVLPHPAGDGPQPGLRHTLINLNTPAGLDAGPARLQHQGLRGQLPPDACTPATVLDGLITPTRPRLLTGGHPTSIVVTDDTTIVADLGNAGRPYRRQTTWTGPQEQTNQPQSKRS